MMRVGGNCVYTLDSGDQSVMPYGIGSGGQLVVEANSRTLLQTTNATSLNVTGNNIYMTDAEQNQIRSLHIGFGLQPERAGGRSGDATCR